MYEKTLRAWNHKMNLISRADVRHIAERHFLPSAGLVRLPVFGNPIEVLDLGTGAGFPGLPLKIVRPNIHLTLLESKRTKTLFLRRVIDDMHLTETEVVWQRAEHLAENSKFRGRYDVVLSRAVTTLAELWRWAQPLLKTSGELIAIKGPDIAPELATLRQSAPEVQVETRTGAGIANLVRIRQPSNP